jgi:hypothetical protein
VNQQHIVFDSARERQIRRVRNAEARRLVVTRAQHEAGIVFWYCLFRQRFESHATPVIVHAAPCGYTVEVAHIVHLGER